MRVGVLSCSVAGGVVAGQVLAGLLAVRIGHIKWQIVFVAMMMTAFIGGLAVQTVHTEKSVGVLVPPISLAHVSGY